MLFDSQTKTHHRSCCARISAVFVFFFFKCFCLGRIWNNCTCIRHVHMTCWTRLRCQFCCIGASCYIVRICEEGLLGVRRNRRKVKEPCSASLLSGNGGNFSRFIFHDLDGMSFFFTSRGDRGSNSKKRFKLYIILT